MSYQPPANSDVPDDQQTGQSPVQALPEEHESSEVGLVASSESPADDDMFPARESSWLPGEDPLVSAGDRYDEPVDPAEQNPFEDDDLFAGVGSVLRGDAAAAPQQTSPPNGFLPSSTASVVDPTPPSSSEPKYYLQAEVEPLESRPPQMLVAEEGATREENPLTNVPDPQVGSFNFDERTFTDQATKKNLSGDLLTESPVQALVDSLPPAPAGDEASAQPPQPQSRRAAWLLGGKLSVGALARVDGSDGASKVATWLDEARRLAKLLDVSMPDLSGIQADSASTDSMAGFHLIFPVGRQIGNELVTARGRDHSALFELAFKSNLLLVLYQPEAPLIAPIADALATAGRKAKLPDYLWQPLVDDLSQQVPLVDLKSTVFELHTEVGQYLARER